jgi:hypothetical protein
VCHQIRAERHPQQGAAVKTHKNVNTDLGHLLRARLIQFHRATLRLYSRKIMPDWRCFNYKKAARHDAGLLTQRFWSAVYQSVFEGGASNQTCVVGLLREAGVAGSNPLAPTNNSRTRSIS